MSHRSKGPSPLYKGSVTHIIDPSHFYMKFGTETELNKFREYQQKMDKFIQEYHNPPDGIESIEVGQDVMVMGDVHWERARVSNIDLSDDNVDVFFIDLGSSKLVNYCQISLVPDMIFSAFPYQASRCELSTISPLSRQWTKRAISVFSSHIMEGPLVIYREFIDEDNDYYSVHVFKWSGENLTWESVAYILLQEEVGMTTDELEYTQLSSEFVIETLSLTEEMQEDQVDDESEEEQDENYSENSQRVELSNTQDIQTPLNITNDVIETLNEEFGYDNEEISFNGTNRFLPAPSDFTSKSKEHSQSQMISASVIPHSHVDILQKTADLDLGKMKEDKVTEYQLNTRTVIELDLERQSTEIHEDTEKYSDDEFGPRDSCIARGLVGQSYHDDYSDEIHKGYIQYDRQDSLGTIGSWKALEPNKVNQIDDDPPPVIYSKSTESLYDQERKISEILSKSDFDIEILIASVHSIVQPDDDIDKETLQMVIMNVLDSIIGKPQLSSEKGFKILRFYSGQDFFEDEFVSCLKTLKKRYVRPPQSVRLGETHTIFATMLADLFIHIESWESRYRKTIQDFVVSVLDGWAVFNKHRMQQADETELIYLQCLSTFSKIAHSLATIRYPDNHLLLLEAVESKLLHDDTSRILRSHYLQLLLQLHNNGASVLAREVSGINKAVQTDVSEISFGDENKSSDNKNKTTQFYRPPRGALYPRRDPSVPTSFDRDEINFNEGRKENSFSYQSSDILTRKKRSIKSGYQIPPRFQRKYLEEKGIPMYDTNDNSNNIPTDGRGDHLSVSQICEENIRHHSGYVDTVVNENNSLLEDDDHDRFKTEISSDVQENAKSDSFDVLEAQHESESPFEALTNSKDFNNDMLVPPPPDMDYDLEAIYGSHIQLNEESVDSHKEDRLIKKYSPAELEALNPYKNINQTNGSAQKLRRYRHNWVTFLKGLPNAADLPIREIFPDIEKKMLPQSGDAPLLTAGKVNWTSWTKLSDLLPASKFNTNKVSKSVDSSVDPITKPDTAFISSENNGELSSLQINVEQSDIEYPENIIVAVEKELVYGSSKENEKVLDIDCAEISDTLHDKENGNEEIEMWDGIQNNGEEKKDASKGKKKKKIKYRPLEDFENNRNTDYVDPFGFDGSEEPDEFSDEMLQYYMDYEENEKLTFVNSESNLSSGNQQRTKIVIERSQRQNVPWEPKNQFCSKCHSQDHIVYNCPEMNYNYES